MQRDVGVGGHGSTTRSCALLVIHDQVEIYRRKFVFRNTLLLQINRICNNKLCGSSRNAERAVSSVFDHDVNLTFFVSDPKKKKLW